MDSAEHYSALRNQVREVGSFLRGVRKRTKESRKVVAVRDTKVGWRLHRLERGYGSLPDKEFLSLIEDIYKMSEEERQKFRQLCGEIIQEQDVQIIDQLLRLPKEIRQRVIRTAIAYDSSQKG